MSSMMRGGCMRSAGSSTRNAVRPRMRISSRPKPSMEALSSKPAAWRCARSIISLLERLMSKHKAPNSRLWRNMCWLSGSARVSSRCITLQTRTAATSPACQGLIHGPSIVSILAPHPLLPCMYCELIPTHAQRDNELNYLNLFSEQQSTCFQVAGHRPPLDLLSIQRGDEVNPGSQHATHHIQGATHECHLVAQAINLVADELHVGKQAFHIA